MQYKSFSISGAATIMGVSRQTIYNWLNAGVLEEPLNAMQLENLAKARVREAHEELVRRQGVAARFRRI